MSSAGATDRARFLSGKALARLLAAILLLVIVASIASRSRPVRPVVPEMIGSDSLADPRAVGMCAVNRETAALEGRIVRIVDRAGSERPHYRVRSLQNPGAEYVMDPARVQVVACPAPVAGD